MKKSGKQHGVTLKIACEVGLSIDKVLIQKQILKQSSIGRHIPLDTFGALKIRSLHDKIHLKLPFFSPFWHGQVKFVIHPYNQLKINVL